MLLLNTFVVAATPLKFLISSSNDAICRYCPLSCSIAVSTFYWGFQFLSMFHGYSLLFFFQGGVVQGRKIFYEREECFYFFALNMFSLILVLNIIIPRREK